MWKDCNVVMIQDVSLKPGNIVMEDGKLRIAESMKKDLFNIKAKPKHLCITSDEEIKEGDWFYHGNCGINQCKEIREGLVISNTAGVCNTSACKKIIATTDTSLLNGECEYCSKGYELDIKCMSHFFPNKDYARCQKDILPQPSQQFIQQWIEEYNKKNIIAKVQVEYHSKLEQRNLENPDFISNVLDVNIRLNQVLKVNSDNTINIKLIKNNYSREEVIELCKNFANYVNNFDGFYRTSDLNKWIEKNL